jgi:hypothetical protein
MKTSNKVENTLLTALLACGLVACTSQETNPNTGSNGGTTAPAATGGVSGGGTTSSGGSSATSSTDATTAEGKLCLPPAQAMITDFTPGATETTQVHFGNSTTLGGGQYVYPAAGGTVTYPLTSDVTGGNWHISGTVGDYSGFGLYWDNCKRVDASKYKGISFKISGTVEQDGMVTFEISTLKDTISAAWLNGHGVTGASDPGTCTPPADATLNQYSQTTCAEPKVSIPVTANPTTQTILWSDFTGGKPEANVTASDILSIHWIFPNPNGILSGTPTPYKADIIIDDLSFVEK